MLTRTGFGVAVGGLLVAMAGFAWGYAELIAAGTAALALVVVAMIMARRPARIEVHRRVLAARVARGDPLAVRYLVTNRTDRRSPPAILLDAFDRSRASHPVPSLAPHARYEAAGEFPTRRRGVFEVGPLSLQRADPLLLVEAVQGVEAASVVMVHPRIHQLPGTAGALRVVADEALLRSSSSDPDAGFQSLREYVYGDDPRLIHWPTSARAGALMVRELVESRRPEFTVVVDCAAHVASEDDFEEMVDVAASIAAFGLSVGVQVVVRTTARDRPGTPKPLARTVDILDLLTPVQQRSGHELLSVAGLFTGGLGGVAVLIVTGPSGPWTTFARPGAVRVTRVGAGATTVGLSGRSIAAVDAKDFVGKWSRWL